MHEHFETIKSFVSISENGRGGTRDHYAGSLKILWLNAAHVGDLTPYCEFVKRTIFSSNMFFIKNGVEYSMNGVNKR